MEEFENLKMGNLKMEEFKNLRMEEFENGKKWKKI